MRQPAFQRKAKQHPRLTAPLGSGSWRDCAAELPLSPRWAHTDASPRQGIYPNTKRGGAIHTK